MAAASADAKLGSLVKEEAICWTKNCWKAGGAPSISRGLRLLFLSHEKVGTGDVLLAMDGESGLSCWFGDIEPINVTSALVSGCMWLCSPSYVATNKHGFSALFCT